MMGKDDEFLDELPQDLPWMERKNPEKEMARLVQDIGAALEVMKLWAPRVGTDIRRAGWKKSLAEARESIAVILQTLDR